MASSLVQLSGMANSFISRKSSPSVPVMDAGSPGPPSSYRPRTASQKQRSHVLPSLPLPSPPIDLRSPSLTPRGPRPTAAMSRSPSSQSRMQPDSPTTTRPVSAFHTRRTSNIIPPQYIQSPIIPVIKQPQVLSSVLSFMLWNDFYALCKTCKAFRTVLRDQRLRDVVLSKFVTGYGLAHRNSDPRLRGEMTDVVITVHDLDVLSKPTFFKLFEHSLTYEISGFNVHAITSLPSTRVIHAIRTIPIAAAST